MPQPSPELLRAVDADEPRAPADRLDALRDECRRLRDDDQEIEDLEARLRAAQARRLMRTRETVVDLMDQAGVTSLSIAAEGNAPAVVVSVKPFYSAGVPAKWPDEKKREAYDWLDANGAGDLIKTSVSAQFPREKREAALAAVAALRELGVEGVEVDQSVHGATLTKWLRESHQAGLPLPPLDVIGAFVGRVAEIKPAKVVR